MKDSFFFSLSLIGGAYQSVLMDLIFSLMAMLIVAMVVLSGVVWLLPIIFLFAYWKNAPIADGLVFGLVVTDLLYVLYFYSFDFTSWQFLLYMGIMMAVLTVVCYLIMNASKIGYWIIAAMSIIVHPYYAAFYVFPGYYGEEYITTTVKNWICIIYFAIMIVFHILYYRKLRMG